MRTMIALILLSISAHSIAAVPPATPGTQAKDDWKMLRILMDKDSNDKISQEEVKGINLMPLRMLERNFTQIDSNKDGAVTPQEYTDHVQKLQASWDSDFQSADADKSGGLSKAELANSKPGQLVRIKRQFDAMDSNKDGQVSKEERDHYTVDKAAAKEAKQVRTKAKAPAAQGTGLPK